MTLSEVVGSVDRAGKNGSAVAPYAVGSTGALSSAQVRVLNLLGQSVVGAWGEVLRVILPGDVSVRALPPTPEAAGIPEEAVALSFVTDTPPATGVLCVARELAFALLEGALGSVRLTAAPERPLTALEDRLLRRLAAPLLEHYAQQWERLLPLQFRVEEAQEQQARRLSRDPEYYLCPFEVTGLACSGGLWIALPLTGAAPLLDRLTVEAWVSGPELEAEAPRVLAALEESRVSVRAVLGEVALTLGEVARLTPGDLVFLPGLDEQSVRVQVADRPKFSGKVRHRQGRLVIELA